MPKLSAKERTIRALMEVFHLTREQVAKDVFTGKEDPGGWAPKAEFTVHTENSIPGYASYSMYAMEKWEEVSDRLGPDLFCEPINGAVVAVYKL